MLKIGMTGGLGAGKSTVSRMFVGLGVPVIDTDEISRALTTSEGKALPAIRQGFGEGVFNVDASLNRAAMRTLVLDDESARRRLEGILHPLIRTEVERRLADVQAPYVLIVVPLLVETGAYDDLLDRVLVVDCSEETQVRRALARGGWAESEIRGMMAKQANRQQRLSRADDILDSECDLAELSSRVGNLDQKYRSLSVRML